MANKWLREEHLLLKSVMDSGPLMQSKHEKLFPRHPWKSVCAERVRLKRQVHIIEEAERDAETEEQYCLECTRKKCGGSCQGLREWLRRRGLEDKSK